jgi:hypothetical protein
MSVKREGHGFYGKNLFVQKNAKGPAGVAYTCNWIVDNTIGMFNPIIW